MDRFVFNSLAVDNEGQTADNKRTGSVIFSNFFFLAGKTNKPLKDGTSQNQSCSKTHLLTDLFLHTLL